MATTLLKGRKPGSGRKNKFPKRVATVARNLYFKKHFTLREISELLGINSGTVFNMVHRKHGY